MKTILQTLKSTAYQANIEVLLNSELCSHKLKVEFALYCATDLDKYYDVEKYPEVYKTRQRCLELIGNWLLDSTKVSSKELNAAANAAFAAAFAADANAAAYAAANAAFAAAYAAHAAVYDSNKQEKLKELYHWLFNKLTENMNNETLTILYKEAL